MTLNGSFSETIEVLYFKRQIKISDNYVSIFFQWDISVMAYDTEGIDEIKCYVFSTS